MGDTSITAQQDALRPLRMFVGALTGALAGADQSFAYGDMGAWNVPGGYQSIGPYGYAVEGKPLAVTRGGGVVISPMLIMIGLGAAAVFIWKR